MKLISVMGSDPLSSIIHHCTYIELQKNEKVSYGDIQEL